MAMYWSDANLAEMAREVIGEHEELAHLDDVDLKIAYQWCDQEKKAHGQMCFADVETVKEKYMAFMPYDFVITFYEPNCVALDDERMKRLMYHELNHVGWDGDGRKHIIPHNLEDFRECIDKWGIDWIKNTDTEE